MQEKITLEMLTQDGVNLKRQNVQILDGVEYPIGEPWRRQYMNSSSDRESVEAEIPEPYKTAIFAVWGDVPTVTEKTE
jgi:hypothetical protein